MTTPLTLLAPSLNVRMESGRRGIDVTCTGAISLGVGTGFDDTTLLLVLLDTDGAVLAVERNSLRLEEANGEHLVFSESLRVPPDVAERIAMVEVWATASVYEVIELGTVDVATQLPAPAPGSTSFHALGGCSIKRLAPDEDGEVRLSVYGRCAFSPGQTYDDRAEVVVTLLDADGNVVHSEDGRIETMGGQCGDAVFDDWFRPQIAQLEQTSTIALRIVTKRWVTTERVAIPRTSTVTVED